MNPVEALQVMSALARKVSGAYEEPQGSRLGDSCRIGDHYCAWQEGRTRYIRRGEQFSVVNLPARGVCRDVIV